MDEKKETRGQQEIRERVISAGLCTGCGACINLCPYFRSNKGKTAILFPCTVEQGRCFAYCPKIEVDLDELSQDLFGTVYKEHALGSYRSIVTAQAGKSMKPLNPQAGGTVSALIYFALSRGYVHGAVLTDRDGILPLPRYVTDPEEACKCAQSKYTAAPTLSSLNKVIADGEMNIGVVGTPCQVLAVAQMRLHRKRNRVSDEPIGLVIGLFCTWALDFRAFEPFIKGKVDVRRVTKVDIPPPPAEVFQVYTDHRLALEIPLTEVRPLVPEGCSYCLDMTAEFSDVSVGVLEGRPDLNTLVIRTERGQRLVEEATQAGYLTISDMPAENLEHLTWAATNKKQRGVSKARERQLINSTPFSYLRLNADTLHRLMA